MYEDASPVLLSCLFLISCDDIKWVINNAILCSFAGAKLMFSCYQPLARELFMGKLMDSIFFGFCLFSFS